MENMFLRWSGCGAFEVRLGDVNVAFDPYLFGENLFRAEPIYDYIFITHEHFDHCHPKSLRQLCRGRRFKRLFVSPGCVDPARPIGERYGDAAFDRDLPITKHIVVAVPGPELVEEINATARSFPREVSEFEQAGLTPLFPLRKRHSRGCLFRVLGVQS
jgi:hypothetical protein